LYHIRFLKDLLNGFDNVLLPMVDLRRLPMPPVSPLGWLVLALITQLNGSH
jgi:hypothetical protein